MPVRSGSRTRAAAASIAACALAACTIARPYPTPTDSEPAALCGNGIDDDLDGAADCGDPDCAGSCPEEDEVACTNGRDDDADGRVDGIDPWCWPGQGVIADRSCLAVAGGSSRWPDAPMVVSSGVEVLDGAIRFPPGLAGYAYGLEVLTGAFDGLRIDIVLDVGPDRWFEIGVLEDGDEPALGVGTATGFGLVLFDQLDEADLTLLALTKFGSRAPLANGDGPLAITAPRTVHVTFEVHRDARSGLLLVQPSIEGEDQVTYEMPTFGEELSRALDETMTLRLFARAEAGDAEIVVRSLEVTRPARPGCGPGVFARRVLAAGETRDGAICVLSASVAPDHATPALDVHRADRWGEPFTRVASIDALERASAAALALQPDGGLAMVIAIAAADRVLLNEIASLRLGALGADCRPVGPLVESGIDVDHTVFQASMQGPRATALGLAIAPDGTQRVTFLDVDAQRLRRAVLPDGPVEEAIGGLPGLPVIDAVAGVGIVDLGTEHVLATADTDGSFALWLVRPDREAERIPLFVPGDPPGAFDAEGGGFPALMLTSPEGPNAAAGVLGLVFEGALSADPDDDAIDTAVFPLRAPPAAR